MNIAKATGLDLDYLSPSNPCFGCTSTACRCCSCAGERLKEDAFGSRSEPLKLNKQDAKATVKQGSKKSTPPTTNSSPMSFAHLPRGIFGSVGEGLILQADGNGMINAGIHTGDWLVFDTQLMQKDGDIAFVTVDGQPMCRRIFSEGDKRRVRREDGVTPDVITDNCVVYAVLIGLMRNVRENSWPAGEGERYREQAV